MNRPLDTVTVSLPAVAMRDLEQRVTDGEFAKLEDAIVAELLELEHHRAVEYVGGKEAFDALVAEVEEELLIDDDPASEVDAFEFLEKLRDEFAEMAASQQLSPPRRKLGPKRV